jgi:hypothetical protein
MVARCGEEGAVTFFTQREDAVAFVDQQGNLV